MLKSISSIVFLCFIFNLFGQKTEFDVSSNASLFSFSGNSVKNGSVTLNKSSNSVYANIPYGAKKGLGDGLSITLKRITKKHFIWGLDLGYESMKSREFINKSISPDVMGIPYIPVPATGKVFMKTNYFIFFPTSAKE